MAIALLAYTLLALLALAVYSWVLAFQVWRDLTLMQLSQEANKRNNELAARVAVLEAKVARIR